MDGCMRQPRSKKILEKSVHAALSAIEVYNKPDFKYREETFAILMHGCKPSHEQT